MRRLAAPALRIVDWTGWSAARIDGFGATWRSLAATNLILRGRGAGMTAPRRRGALTAKFAWHGSEQYRVDKRTLTADDDGWVVIGSGELYDSRIAPGREVTTIATFFDDAMVSAVRGERRANEGELLESDSAACTEPLPIGRRRLAYDRELALAVADAATAAQPLALEELLLITLERILDAAREVARERLRLPCVRVATRAELHRRLSRAHDLLMAAYAEPLDLTRLAGVAAMAPHHFLRRFRDAFGVTPHQELVRRRIERARILLARTDEPIAAIAHAVGFETAAAFAARFRRAVGVSPRAFRNSGTLCATGPALASKE